MTSIMARRDAAAWSQRAERYRRIAARQSGSDVRCQLEAVAAELEAEAMAPGRRGAHAEDGGVRP